MVLTAALAAWVMSVGPKAEQVGFGSEWSRQVEVELIVDGSGSMAGAVSGQSKISWAKGAIHSILGGLPDTISGADVGLRVYGARSPKAKHDCQDTHLEVPLNGVNERALSHMLDSVHPSGYTPIAASLEAAAKDFQKQSDRVVVIITDGVESCGGDPCETSQRLVAEGAFQKPYVIGFAVNEEEKAKLSCMGTYLDARSGADLQRLLDDVIKKAVVAARLEVTATYNQKKLPASLLSVDVKKGSESRSLEPGKAVRVPPGEYEVEISQREDSQCGPVVEPVKVEEGAIAHVVGLFGKGSVAFEMPAGAGDIRRTSLQIWPAGKLGQGAPLLSGNAIQSAKLCAGKYDFRVRSNKGVADVVGYDVKPNTTAKVRLSFSSHGGE